MPPNWAVTANGRPSNSDSSVQRTSETIAGSCVNVGMLRIVSVGCFPSPKISAFSMRRGKPPVVSGKVLKILKIDLIPVGSGDLRSRFEFG
jgi:hypothetical protein